MSTIIKIQKEDYSEQVEIEPEGITKNALDFLDSIDVEGLTANQWHALDWLGSIVLMARRVERYETPITP